MSDRFVLGVLGGMGPAATADFMAKLVRATPARRDQDHLPVIAMSAPYIPDRTEAIMNDGPSPLPAMLDALKCLERAGASRIAIPCNTAHNWFDDLQARTHVRLIHIATAVVEALRREGSPQTVGLLATDATLRGDIYGRRLAAAGFTLVTPSSEDQAATMRLIRDIKARLLPQHGRRLADLADRLRARGAHRVILGCTELPLASGNEDEAGYLDSTAALAVQCIRGFDPPSQNSVATASMTL